MSKIKTNERGVFVDGKPVKLYSKSNPHSLAMRVQELEKEIHKLRRGQKQSVFRKHYSSKEFKKTFKIGDFITGWATGKVVQIIAIGNERILWIDSLNGYEGVSKMNGNAWALVKQK